MNRGLIPFHGDKPTLSGLGDFTAAAPSYGSVPVYDPPNAQFALRKGSRWNPALSAYNVSPTSLASWRKAVTKYRAGTAAPTILAWGDSTTAGISTSGLWPYSYPFRLGQILATKGGISFNEGAWGPTAASGSDDARATLGSGWSSAGNTSGVTCSSGAAGNLSITPTVSFDTIKVWFAQNGGLGTSTINVDGGSSLGNIVTAGSQALGSATFTCAAGTHTINIAPPGSSLIEVIMVEVSTAGSLKGRIYNYGVNGWTINSLVTATTNSWVAFNAVTTLAPDLTTLNMTINDYGTGSPTNLAQYKSQMQSAITKAKTYGDCLLIVGNPGSGKLPWPGYRETCYDLADSNDCALFDLIDRWQSYTISNAAGLYFDTQHPSVAGHHDIAAGLANVLLAVT